mgnify:FL=1
MENTYVSHEYLYQLSDNDLEYIAQNIKKDKAKAFIAACLLEIRNTKHIKTKTEKPDVFTHDNHFLNIMKKWNKTMYGSFSLFEIYSNSNNSNTTYFAPQVMDFDYSKTPFKKTTGTILKNAICIVYENWRGWDSTQQFNYKTGFPYNEPIQYSIKLCIGDITKMVWAQYMRDYKYYHEQSLYKNADIDNTINQLKRFADMTLNDCRPTKRRVYRQSIF